MWNQIVNDLKRLKTHQMKAMEVSKMIVEMEGKMAERRLLVGDFVPSCFCHDGSLKCCFLRLFDFFNSRHRTTANLLGLQLGS